MSDKPYDWSRHKQDERPEGDRPPIWKAVEVGDSIAGTITELWTYKKGDAETPVLNLDTFAVGEDGTVGEATGPGSVWASQVLLRQAIADQEPQVGDRIKITFVGTKETASGNTMKEFDVTVRKPKAAAEPEPPPEPVTVPEEWSEEPF